jgi:anti-sigma regulatory factor (Ser/Thr protein kinase)
VFLQNAIAGRVDTEMQSELTLVLSELASNVVRHARTPFEVVVETNGHVRIEVGWFDRRSCAQGCVGRRRPGSRHHQSGL